jgi:carboxymethylenebutenolidase
VASVRLEDNRVEGRDRPNPRESSAMTDLSLPAFSVAPADAPASGPGVVVVHEGNGMSAQLIRFGERLAREGYRVIAPDFFSRSHGVDPSDFGAIIGSITPENLKGDFAAAVEQLRAGGASKVGVTGFCMGGWFTYRAAKWADDLGVDAAVPFYGGGIARDLGDLHCPTLMFFGDRDDYVPMADVESVKANHSDAEIIVYPGAEHGFMRDGSDNYDEKSATDAWGRLLAFFGEHLR